MQCLATRTGRRTRRTRAYKHHLEMTQHGPELTAPLPKGAGPWVAQNGVGMTRSSRGNPMAEVRDGKAAGELNTRERREEVFLTLALNTIGPLIFFPPLFFFWKRV